MEKVRVEGEMSFFWVKLAVAVASLSVYTLQTSLVKAYLMGLLWCL